MTTKVDLERYCELLRQLVYAAHELPASVLYGADGATPAECMEWMQDLLEFEQFSKSRGKSHDVFIEEC
ncbi:hypothetical protein [Plasticicumulans acidivorans]|uniref:hypothetical protein n=1 Tax=Plasticicumulans acidivorans TaxID=886464 RepID=UPI000D7193CD|nr:hypothetical protein [Plasticicumulans acidivorans]